MKFLGIDYGSKRVGLSVSDDGANLAFPYSVLKNDNDLLSKIKEIAEKEKIQKIVIGESTAFSGTPNPIMKEIDIFMVKLKNEVKLDIILEPEFLSSFQAERVQGKHDMLDASASAIILQSYLDKKLS